MALLHLPSSPSTPCFYTDHHHPHPHQTLHKTSSPSIHLQKNKIFSLSWSISPALSFSHSQTLHNRPKKFSHFVLNFSSSTIQDPVVASSSPDADTEILSEQGSIEEEYSRTRLLVSNVPWTCTTEDIRTLFQKFGTVLDVELSMHSKTRNRGLAFVTMGSSEEALAALQNLESYEFEGRSLKMNYANPKKQKVSPVVPEKPAITFNLFVANLPFDARDKDLKAFFNTEGSNVVSTEIIYHDSPRRSSGYGFVAFKSKKEAEAALSAFQDKIFMGRPLRVARSKPFVRERKKEGLKSDDTTNSAVEQEDSADDS